MLKYLEKLHPSASNGLGSSCAPQRPASHDQSSAGSASDEGSGGVTERSRPEEEEQQFRGIGSLSHYDQAVSVRNLFRTEHVCWFTSIKSVSGLLQGLRISVSRERSISCQLIPPLPLSSQQLGFPIASRERRKGAGGGWGFSSRCPAEWRYGCERRSGVT